MSSGLAAACLALCIGAGDELAKLQGTWKISAAFEDGKALDEQEIATGIVADGQFVIDGPLIRFLPPGSFERKEIAFTVDPQANPKAIDLVGADKVGSRGIYLLSGDSLMVCLPGPKEKDRPGDFGVSPGSERVLLILKRLPAKASPAPEGKGRPAVASSTAPEVTLPRAPSAMHDMRKALIGTWGHQTGDAVLYLTLNDDGTFSTVVQWKKSLKKVFNGTVRSSGQWKLDAGVIIATVTASTDARLRGQVHSWRVTHLGEKALIAVDEEGRTRHEWRVR